MEGPFKSDEDGVVFAIVAGVWLSIEVNNVRKVVHVIMI
jgi:hypothetical protein